MPKPGPQQSDPLQDAGEEMMPVDPPAAVARLTGWLLVLLFLSLFIISFTVPIPETIRCRFELVSGSGLDPVQTRLMAVLDDVAVREGQAVAQGDLLFALRSDEILSWRTQMENHRESLDSARERSTRAAQAFENQMDITRAMLTNAINEVAFSRQYLSNRVQQADNMEILFRDKIISQFERDNYQLHKDEAAKNLQIAINRREQIELELQRLSSERARESAREEAEIRQLETTIASLERQLEDAEEDRLVIRAPYDAEVVSLEVHQPGTVVNEGQVLCQLARREGDPVVRLFFNEEDLPKLEAGLKGKMLFDAFPYQRYGTLEGTVEWISPTAVETEDGRRFLGRLGLSETEVRVSGESRTVRIGMKGEARIRVGDRKLIDYAFEPIRQLRENMAE